jgi:pyruvate,orthophosphate dikinase
LLHPTFDPKAKKDVLAKGLPASPGAAVGRVVFSRPKRKPRRPRARKVILVRVETSPDDIRACT